MLKSYKDLIVWQKAYNLSLMIYKETEKFPRSEQFGLSNQLRRCGVSIVSNIAEGFQRQYTNEFIQFLSMAFGSCAECETQIMLAKDLKYLPEDKFEKLIESLNEIGKMLNSLIKKLKCKVGR